jgi:hypothetical protein
MCSVQQANIILLRILRLPAIPKILLIYSLPEVYLLAYLMMILCLIINIMLTSLFIKINGDQIIGPLLIIIIRNG